MYNYVDKYGNQFSYAEPMKDSRLTHVTEVAAPIIRKITSGAFYGRFTNTEAVAIEDSTDSNVKVFMRKLLLRSHVDLDFHETIDGLNYLVSVGLLTEARKAALLQDGGADEAWTG